MHSACDEHTLPSRAGSNTESHVSLLRQRVVSQLAQVLRSQVLVRVSGHRFLTYQHKKKKGLPYPSEKRRPFTATLTL